MQFYPFLFEPNLHSVVWGGHEITRWKGLPGSSEPIGESWEVSAVPSNVSIIANGVCKGESLTSIIEKFPKEILGQAVANKYNNQLPLLVKFIDAYDDLSIQVHPNDEMAGRLHQKRGKSEMWYVIDAQPGAYLYAGFSKSLIPEDDFDKAEDKSKVVEAFHRRVADGTITEVLAKHDVKPGDVFYLPAGRIHAIGKGILLAEVQQSSDVTYRVFDYNRPGMDGKPRELHVDLAAEALDFEVKKDYVTRYEHRREHSNHVVDSPFFNVRLIDTNRSFHRKLFKYDSFIILMCLHGDCRIKLRKSGEEVFVREGFSTLIPAIVADYDIIPDNMSGNSQVLEAFIDNR